MDYLVQHAIDNVWCSPRQDRHFITRPKRISRNSGEVVQFESDWLQIFLPDNKNYYHLYQIGGLHPDFLGLFPVEIRWVSLQEVCNRMGMLADLYANNGRIAPKFETYYMVTRAGNLLIATRKREEQLKIDYNNEDLYFRVYTNAFYQSSRSQSLTEKVVTKGGSPGTMAEILAMQQDLQAYRSKTVGYAWAIINGLYYEEISPFTCKVGDLVDWVYDSSVSKVVEFEINKLPAFDSTRDQQRKYLLHYGATMPRIQYEDDVDLFLVERPAVGKANGLYHHKNTAKALRMVTHKDYSMSVQLVNAFVDGHPTWTDPQKLRVLAMIRENGFNRSLVFENNRIHELYKLSNTQILPAMVGEYSAVPNWQAAYLENSKYNLIMEQPTYKTITRAMVQEAYGYNAMSKILGDTPMKVEVFNGQRSVSVPRGLYENATAYEYDANGLLLGWYYHPVGTRYIVNNAACTLVEMVVGRASQQIDDTYDKQKQTLDPKLNYRMYICDKLDGVSLNNWRDVTGSANYAMIGDELQWLVNMNAIRTLVRSDKIPLGYIFQTDCRDGLLEFDLTQVTTVNGVTGSRPLEVPMGELDLFLNGRSIIEGIDYVIQGYKGYIHNKKYLINPETQKQEIAIRAMGFCKKDMTREKAEDVNFVKWELLSRNSVFNIRDDRVLRIVVDGRLYHRDSLKYSEKDTAYLVPSAQNGVPYAVRDMVVPMRSLTDGDTYSLRAASRVIDASVSEYLSANLPEPVPSAPNVINEKYPVFTPFLCKIIYDLVDRVIDPAVITDNLDMAGVKAICAPYEPILAFDPTQAANALNSDYVIIHPIHHNNVMTVSRSHFNFLQKVILTYMSGKVVLNNFLRLSDAT